ncbi:putative adenosine deaminase [Phaeomoniella chlamydospora]|uniref:Adenine deaminase n=1 Tax=Phaeomoniella chlamydospora TaxID=158046 RepID=A0A0G2GLZ5_PHACM|nr:putative adenosine deaminase [Phaeomoniella chlamydospora]
MHLEGSLSPQLLFQLASKHNIPLPASDPAFTSPDTLLLRYENFTSLDDFLHYYYLGMSTLIDEADFEALAWEYFVRAKSEGVVHAEVFFDPQGHETRGISYHTVVSGFNKACVRARTELDLSNELIVCFLRHLPALDADRVFKLSTPDIQSGLIKGIGLDSSEVGNPPAIFKDTYLEAESLGFKRTMHAGEEASVDYMVEALDVCHVQRMDHGIKLTESPSFLQRVADAKIMVTICPLSNVRLRCLKHVSELPLREYLDAGVIFSLNSDDPAYFGGHILENYCQVQAAFKFGIQDWAKIVKGSVEGSWCSQERKTEILGLLEGVMEKYKDLK